MYINPELTSDRVDQNQTYFPDWVLMVSGSAAALVLIAIAVHFLCACPCRKKGPAPRPRPRGNHNPPCERVPNVHADPPHKLFPPYLEDPALRHPNATPRTSLSIIFDDVVAFSGGIANTRPRRQPGEQPWQTVARIVEIEPTQISDDTDF